ncbi:hypothetical protein [uncultured Kordia sp.]|uniref:hypothetical protein n=1 Tax=uncultured Kordia sp. TaxID=507699 RepID=UPI0026053970|nr:hypothetical protein [uncultured Kordia sp.]
MNRNFLIGILLGLLIGTPLIFFGIQFFIKDLESLLRILFWIIIMIILLSGFIYVNRDKILRLIGIKINDIEGIKENTTELISAINNGEERKVKTKGIHLLNQFISKYTEYQFRVWLFRIAFSLIALIGSMFIASLAIKQNEIIEIQNELISNQGDYLIKLNEPLLDINENTFTLEQSGSKMSGKLNFYLKNFGQRAAKNIKYEVRFFERLLKENKLIELQIPIKEELSNYISKGNSININTAYYKEDNENDVLILFDLMYDDAGIDTNSKNVKLFFKVPAPVKTNLIIIKTSLYNARKEEERLILDFLKKEK